MTFTLKEAAILRMTFHKVKFVGVCLQPSLVWQKPTDMVAKKVCKIIYLSRHLSNYISTQIGTKNCIVCLISLSYLILCHVVGLFCTCQETILIIYLMHVILVADAVLPTDRLNSLRIFTYGWFPC